MKYTQVTTWFEITTGKFKGWVVQPFNAETEEVVKPSGRTNDVSHSHGITHCKTSDGMFAFHCGTSVFERIAKEIP